MRETFEITVWSAGRPFSDAVATDGNAALLRPTELGMVVCEHVDKLGFFERSVEVMEKELLRDGLRFVLQTDGEPRKPLAEIVRGFKIGCFKIAREYRLVRAEDPMPIFRPGFELRRKPV